MLDMFDNTLGWFQLCWHQQDLTFLSRHLDIFQLRGRQQNEKLFIETFFGTIFSCVCGNRTISDAKI